MKRKVLCFVFLVVPLVFSSMGFAQNTTETFDVLVSARPFVDFEPEMPEKIDFGQLRFSGGAVLTSKNRHFGGLSGMQLMNGGRSLLAVSDSGFWLHADIVRNAKGFMSGLENVRMASISSGRTGPHKSHKYYRDAEGIASSGEDIFVSFEAINVISKYKLNIHDLNMKPTLLPLPTEIKQADFNRGMEALALAPAGSPLEGHLLTITEQGGRSDGPAFGWILKPKGESPLSGKFTLRRDNPFAVTEAEFLKNGDLLVLERRFTIADGVGMRLRRVKADTIKAGVELDGEILLEAGLSHRIDNMEAMAIYENSKGETVLAFLSDDNHSLLQRTIFFEFVLSEE